MFALLEREVAGKNTMWYQGEEYRPLKPRRCPMPVPIICLDEYLQQFAERFRHELSKPQYQYFVIVLLGLMLCEGRRTLQGLLRQIADGPSLAGLSRFLAQAPWQAAAIVDCWLRHFREEMQPLVEAEQQRHRQAQPKRRGPRDTQRDCSKRAEKEEYVPVTSCQDEGKRE
jgi:hypothetical protein